MGLHSDFTLHIDGEQIPSIVNFTLEEQVGDHARFTVTIRTDVLEQDTERDHILGKSRKYIGKDITIQLHAFDSYKEHDVLEFKGIIASMNSNIGFEGSGNDLIAFKGSSTSIILDDGARYRSFTEMSLSDIAQQTIGTYDQSKLNIIIAPENNSTQYYSVMYGESRYQYLKRLAISRGEYLLFNRDTLYFGKPNLGDTVVLNYGTDLKNFTIGVTPKQGKTTYTGYNYHTEEQISVSTADKISQAQGATAFASNIANRLYHQDAQAVYAAYEHSELMQRMDQLVTVQQQVTEQQQVMIQAKSTNPSVTLGKVITIESNLGSFGSYRITKISHHITGTGTYQNTFEAVPLDIDIFPLTNIDVYCKAHSHIATIVDTNDPKKMSRVKIRYPFDEITGTSSPWLQVATPYAGNEYGMHTIPETGSGVMVQYHQGNVEQPYVANSFYTGVNKYTNWQSENNDYKGLTSRSGHKIELKDTQDGEMITITDKNGNLIKIDTVNNNMILTANETLTLEANNIVVKTKENIDLQAQGNINTASQGDTTILAEGSNTLQATGDTNITSDAAITVQATNNTNIKGQNVSTEAETTATLKGQQTKVQGQQATIQGATHKTEYK
jgi:uncharacterized protein involved in type VI secretion and phage assembly